MRNFCDKNNIVWLNHAADGVDYTFHNDVNCHCSLIDNFYARHAALTAIHLHLFWFTGIIRQIT